MRPPVFVELRHVWFARRLGDRPELTVAYRRLQNWMNRANCCILSCRQQNSLFGPSNYARPPPSISLTMFICFLWRCGLTRAVASSLTRFLDHTQRRTTVGRTPLDEWPARRRDLYLTTDNTHNRQTSLPPVGFEPTISASERPQTYALDRAAIGTGLTIFM